MVRWLGETSAVPLPPPEFRRFIPNETKRLFTPTHENGLIDQEQLISLVKATVDPAFTWTPSEPPNRHHLYWPRSNYPLTADHSTDLHEFRNLASNIILLPEMFHNWLHLVTLRPRMPDEETIRHCIEAERVVVALFTSARRSKRLIRRGTFQGGAIDDQLTQYYEQFSTDLEKARAIPKEFQLIDLSDFHLETARDMHAVGSQLGELAVRRTVSRVRDVFRPLAA